MSHYSDAYEALEKRSKRYKKITDSLAIEIAKLSHQIQELKFSVDRLARSIDRSKSIGHAMEMRLLGDKKE